MHFEVVGLRATHALCYKRGGAYLSQRELKSLRQTLLDLALASWLLGA